MHLAFSERFMRSAESGQQFGDTGSSPGMVRFFINLGRSANMRPQELSKVISENAGINLRQIGRINIYDRFSFVEVAEDAAPFVYEALRQSRINGMRVNLEPARPRQNNS